MGNIYLEAHTYAPVKPYKLILTLKDSTGQVHDYEISGTNLAYEVKEL